MEPLSTTEGIRAAIKQDPKLRFDPTLIQNYLKSGGTLSNGVIPEMSGQQVPVTTPQVQQTTTSMRTQANEYSSKLDTHLSRVSPAQEGTGQNNSVTVTRDQDNGDGTRSVTYSDGKTARVQATKNDDGTESYKELDPKEGIKYDYDRGVSESRDRQAQRVQYVTDTLDSLAERSNSSTKALIDSTKKTYEARIKLMEESNKRVLGAKKQLGIRSGRSKYVSDVQADIISDEENKGTARIASLEGQMLSLIAQAENARDDKDLEIFNKRMDELDKTDKQMQLEVQNLHKVAQDKLKQMQDEDKADLDQRKGELQMQLDTSKRAAPSLAKTMAQFKSDEQKASFIEAYAEKTGIPPEILLGDIEESVQDDQKAALDLQNIRNSIDTRNRNADTSERNANIAERRLANDEEKNKFTPSSDEKGLVGTYLASDAGKKAIFGEGVNVTAEDFQAIMSDPQTFYYVLGLAKDAEL